MNKFIKLIGITAIVALSQSCSYFDDNSDETSPDEAPLAKGSYIFGSEVSSFQPCGEALELWVIGEEQLITGLQNDYMDLVNKPYEQVFVSFRGHSLEKAKDGFAADYDGQFKVTEVVTIQQEDICK